MSFDLICIIDILSILANTTYPKPIPIKYMSFDLICIIDMLSILANTTLSLCNS
jgi:hypothetical protein